MQCRSFVCVYVYIHIYTRTHVCARTSPNFVDHFSSLVSFRSLRIDMHAKEDEVVSSRMFHKHLTFACLL